MNPSLQKAQLLLSQGRVDLAEQEVGRVLAENPQDTWALILMTHCCLQSDDLASALEFAQQAVANEPDEPVAFQTLAQVQKRKRLPDRALESLDEALRLDPEDATTHGMIAAIHYEQRRWKLAVESAETGLALDPDESTCEHVRALALERLGQTGLSVAAARETLSKNPDDSEAHAVHAWALLTDGKYREAQEGFREALRLDPNDGFARQGMIQALNANSLVFRLLLKYQMWMSRLSSKVQWVVIIVILVGRRVLSEIAAANPAFAPWIEPILTATFVLIAFSWLADPIFNTFLRLHPFGKHLLDRRQVMASNCILALVSIGVLVSAWWLLILLVLGDFSENGLEILGVIWLLVTFALLPVSAAFRMPAGWPTWVMSVLAIGLAGTAVYMLAAISLGLPLNVSLVFSVFILAAILSQILANVLISTNRD